MKQTISTARIIALMLICAVALSAGAQTRKSKRSEAPPSPWGFTHVAINNNAGDDEAYNNVILHKSPSAASPLLVWVKSNKPPELAEYIWRSEKKASKLGNRFIAYPSFTASPIFGQSGDWFKVTQYYYGNHFGWVEKSDCRVAPVDPIKAEWLRREGCYVISSGPYKNYVIRYMSEGIDYDLPNPNDEVFSIGRLINGKYVEKRYVTLKACRKCFGKGNFIFNLEENSFEIRHYSNSAMKRLI